MPQRIGRADDVGELQAPDKLSRLAVFAEGLSGARGAALRELRARHFERPIGAAAAYRLALGVLGRDVEAFEAWAASPDCSWSRWATIEGDAMRARVRVTKPPGLQGS